MNRSLSFVLLGASLVACQGFKEAMSSHVDIAAKAGSQELSVGRLSDLLVKVKVPITPDIAKTVTDLWVTYQLMGQAAAHGDSLTDTTLINKAMWPLIAQARASKWHDEIAKSYPALDTAAAQAKYESGDVLAASHILLLVPQGATQAQKDSIKKKADALRAQVNAENFATLAKANSQDPSSARNGGSLGVFPKGVMVKEFESALTALKPGEISPVVLSQFGYHIIRRTPFSDAKADVTRFVSGGAMRTADSVYFTKLEASGDVKFKPDAAKSIRSVVPDIEGHRGDQTVIATSKAGDFTVGRLAQWIDAAPQKEQIRQGLQNAPDSGLMQLARTIIRNELLLKQADSAKVSLDAAEMTQMHSGFTSLVNQRFDELGVAPKMLSDSGKTPVARERVAAAHIDGYLDKLFANQTRYIDVPGPVQTALRDKYDWKVNNTALSEAVERAKQLKQAQDSLAAKSRPPTAVPLGPPGTGAPKAAPAAPPPAPAPAGSPPPASPPAGQRHP
jgi:peptidyl-prolyl cis-trans isomerase D